MSGRQIKKIVSEILRQEDFEFNGIRQLLKFPLKSVVNALFPLLYNEDEGMLSRTSAAIGAVVSLLAQSDMEAARNVMRRLMWSLNEESGGIGWGAPEAMGEIMVHNKQLADEYHHILISYTQDDQNLLEHPVLQKGVHRALKRLSEARPELFLKFTIQKESGMQTQSFSVPNISCGHCVAAIKKELSELQGIIRVEGDPSAKTITVEWKAPLTLEIIKKTLKEINYPAE